MQHFKILSTKLSNYKTSLKQWKKPIAKTTDMNVDMEIEDSSMKNNGVGVKKKCKDDSNQYYILISIR